LKSLNGKKDVRKRKLVGIVGAGFLVSDLGTAPKMILCRGAADGLGDEDNGSI
jgi:hypothetical protein